jgi:hypothetical protein
MLTPTKLAVIGIFTWLVGALFSVGTTGLVIWAIIHFVRKFW